MVAFNIIALLMYFVASPSLVSKTDASSDPTIKRSIIPQLQNGTTILSFNTIHETYFPMYTQPSSRILEIIYTDPQGNNSFTLGKNFDLLICQKNAPHIKGMFVCFNDVENTLDTRNYTPDPSLKHTLTLRIGFSGQVDDIIKTRGYFIVIEIVTLCEGFSNIYRRLQNGGCTPKYVPLQRAGFTTDANGRNDGVEFEIPNKYKNKFIIVNGLSFSDTGITSQRWQIAVYDEKKTQLLKSATANAVTTGKTIPIDIRVPKSGQKYMVKLTNPLSQAIITAPSTIKLHYYVLSELCMNKECLSIFYNWQFLSSMTNGDIVERGCINDTRNLKSKYERCSSLSSLDTVGIASSKSEYRLGDSLDMECTTSEILLPYQFVLLKRDFTSGIEKVVSVNKTNYNVHSTAYEDYAYYRCRMVTFDSKYIFYSTDMQVKFTDIFKAKLSFKALLSDFLVTTFEKVIRENIKSIINTKYERIHVNPDFMDVSYSNNKETIDVVGTVAMTKITSELVAMTYKQWSHEVSVAITTGLVNDTKKFTDVAISSFESCPSGQTTSSNGLHTFRWNAMDINEVGRQKCPDDGQNNVVILCSIDKITNLGKLQNFSDANCVYKNKSLTELSKENVTIETVEELSGELQTLSANIASSIDLQLAIKSLENLVGYVNATSLTEENIFNTLDNILDIKLTVLEKSQEEDSTSERFINVVNKVGGMISSDPPRTVSKRNYALGGWKLDPKTNQNNISVQASSSSSPSSPMSPKTKRQRNTLTFVKDKSPEMSGNTDGIITLPTSLMKSLANSTASSTTVDVVSVVYAEDKLFKSDKSSTNNQRAEVGTHVLSTEIRKHCIEKLSEPVVMTFKLTKEKSTQKFLPTCVYWDMNRTEWSTSGLLLSLMDEKNELATCKSDHLTNFAILFNAKPPADETHRTILTIVTYVGLGVSLGGAFLTLLTYLIFPMLREAVPPKILMNLCTAIILMNIVFVVGIEKSAISTGGCQAIAFLIQYFFLCIFFWSGVEGFHSARGLVFPMKVEIRMFIRKSCLFGWGLPLAITSVGFGVWRDEYGSDTSCAVRGKPFFVTVLVPVAFILCFNMVSIVAIFSSLQKSSNKYTTHGLTVKDRIRIIATFSLLFGLTWIFGFLVIDNDIVAFQYIFCSFSALQGFYILFVYCIRNEKVRIYWAALVQGNSVQDIKRTSTRKLQKKSRAFTMEETIGPSLSDTQNYSVVSTPGIAPRSHKPLNK